MLASTTCSRNWTSPDGLLAANKHAVKTSKSVPRMCLMMHNRGAQCNGSAKGILHFDAVDDQISQPHPDRHQPQHRKAGGHPLLLGTGIVLYLAYLLLASAEIFHPLGGKCPI